MISPLGILDGITALAIVFSSTIFGLYLIYKAKKLKAKLLYFAGFDVYFVGLLWLGPLVDFFSVVITSNNIEPNFVYGLLSYTWAAPAGIVAFYLGAELLLPEKKWIIVGIYTIVGIIFDALLWFDWQNAFTIILKNPGEDLLDISFNRTHPLSFINIFYLVSTLIFLSIGFAIKARQSSGVVKKKFYYLSIGYLIFVLTGGMDSVFPIGVAIGFIRVVMTTFALWMYLGFKPSTAEIIKQKPSIERLVDGLGIDYVKPKDLTEKEVAFYREQTICLVCKKQIIGFSYVFICRTCRAFYCEKCAKALIQLENMCWSCDNAIKKRKKTKPLKLESDEIKIEKEDIPHKVKENLE